MDGVGVGGEALRVGGRGVGTEKVGLLERGRGVNG